VGRQAGMGGTGLEPGSELLWDRPPGLSKCRNLAAGPARTSRPPPGGDNYFSLRIPFRDNNFPLARTHPPNRRLLFMK
jgi:hypothetical protein